MTDRRDNIFRFRRLKWGKPKRLDGLKAIGLGEGRPAPAPERGGMSLGAVGLWVAGITAALTIAIGVLGGF